MKTFITGLLIILSVVLLMISGIEELQAVALTIFAISCATVLGLFLFKLAETIIKYFKK